MLSLSNGKISVKIDESLGGEIRSIKVGKTEFMATFDWRSPISSERSRSYGNAILDWLSDYRGGWQALFPNAGNENSVLGVPLPFHGELSRTKVEVISKKKGELVIRTGSRLPLTLTRKYKLHSSKPILTISQSVENEADFEVPFIWGEHPAYELKAGSRIHMAKGPLTVDFNEMGELQDVKLEGTGTWPMAPTKDGGTVDLSKITGANRERLAYIHDRPEGWYAIDNGEKIFGLSWDLEAFPHLWFWQEIGGTGFPWFGRSKITAVEPASTWPSLGLQSAIERKQAFFIKPGEKKSCWTTFSVSSLPSKRLTDITSINEKGEFKTN